MDHRRNRAREKRALGLSVLLHAFVAPLFVAMVVGVNDLRPEGPTPASGLFSITVSHRAAPAPVRPEPAVSTTVRVAAPVSSPSLSQHPLVVAAAQRHTSGAPNKTRRVALVAPAPTPLPTPTHRPATAVPAPAKPAEARGADVAAATAAPAPESAAASPEAAQAALVEAPIGGWGQNFRDPVVLDDDTLAAIRSRYHGVVAHIEVDEEGHATRVSVEGGGLDADARGEIERRLMAARYVPAECNGLRCAASLQLRV
jgi:hypothetical protein